MCLVVDQRKAKFRYRNVLFLVIRAKEEEMKTTEPKWKKKTEPKKCFVWTRLLCLTNNSIRACANKRTNVEWSGSSAISSFRNLFLRMYFRCAHAKHHNVITQSNVQLFKKNNVSHYAVVCFFFLFFLFCRVAACVCVIFCSHSHYVFLLQTLFILLCRFFYFFILSCLV